jgi:hypothetical protein
VKVGVIVLGMHRSGTSALARVVNLLGVPINIPTDWLPEAPDNPRGFWESAALVDINDRLLAVLASSSINPARLDPGWEFDSSVEPLVEPAAAAFRMVFPTHQWVWKDPRTCLTLPFWRRILDVRLAVVLVYRNPVEVARSLSGRDRLTKAHCLALWEHYVRTSLSNAQGLPVLVMSYADLLEDPRDSCEQLRSFLANCGLALEAQGVAGAQAFLDTDLRHHKLSASELEADPDVLESQAQVFNTLQALRGAHPVFDCPTMPGESKWVNDFLERGRTDAQAMRELVAAVRAVEDGKQWLEEDRLRWKQRADELQAAALEMAANMRSVEGGKQWLEEDRLRWKQRADELQAAALEMAANMRAIEDGKQWLEDDRLRWKQRAEELQAAALEVAANVRAIEDGKLWFMNDRLRWKQLADERGELIQHLQNRLSAIEEQHPPGSAIGSMAEERR